MAAVIRLQLAVPEQRSRCRRETFNRLFTMHGTAMVFLVGMPMIAGLMNYLVPLMIGARDMAFPGSTRSVSGCFFSAALLLYFSYLAAPGWRARLGAGCRLVCLRAADRPRLLARAQHGLLDSEHPGRRRRQHRLRHQCHRHRRQHALQRHDPRCACRSSSG